MKSDRNFANPEDAVVVRTGDDSVEISWTVREATPEIIIYRGESPAKIDHRTPAARVKGRTHARLTGLDPGVRYYFELVSNHGPGMIISERRVPLQGAVNFRDLGGYETADGRRVKWGLLFRSDNLGRITDGDLAILRRMGIRQVCDFRTPAEVQKLPDRFPVPGESNYLHLPIKHGEFDPANAFERLKNGDFDWMSEEFMIKGYIRNVENFGALWSEFYRCVVEPANRPLLFHCTGGKDRAGVCAALILLALGVPAETVIQDHGLSNVYIADVVENISARIKALGVDPHKVAPYFTAPQSAIQALITHIRNTYGSADGYLRIRAGVDDMRLQRLKADLLE